MKELHGNREYLCWNIFPDLDLDLPVIYVPIDHLENFSHDKPHGMWVGGNEKHLDLSSYIRGNTKFIIKSYPYIKGYHPCGIVEAPQKYITMDTGRPFIRNDEYHSNIINIPLGPLVDIVNYTRELPVLERDIDMGFYGQSSGIRSTIFDAINEAQGLSNLEVKLYDGFGMGRGEADTRDYTEFLKRSKVTLCPTGHSPETYRFAEAIMAASMPVSSPLPYTEYYCETTHPVLLLAASVMKIFPHENYSEFQQQNEWADKWLNPSFLKKYIETRVGKL